MSEYVVDFSKVATKTTGELEGFDRLRATLMFLVREEIVRCRDCVICHRDEVGMWCCLCGTGFYRRPTGESDFCSKGKRRDA